jgi:kynureninase
LREISRHQVGLLKRSFEGFDVDPTRARLEPMPDERRAGFLAIRSSRAADLSKRLRLRGVLTDCRGETLRLGPAPYLSDEQLLAAMDAFRETLKSI